MPGIDEYVSRTWHRFFVFGPEGGRPWMQDPQPAEQCDPDKSAGVNKLIVTRPAGNAHAWFRHGSDARPDLPTVADVVLMGHYDSHRHIARQLGLPVPEEGEFIRARVAPAAPGGVAARLTSLRSASRRPRCCSGSRCP